MGIFFVCDYGYLFGLGILRYNSEFGKCEIWLVLLFVVMEVVLENYNQIQLLISLYQVSIWDSVYCRCVF